MYAVRYSGPKGYVDARFNTKAEATAYKKRIGRGRVVKSNPSVSGVKFTLKKVALDSGGYTRGRHGGKYFGVGMPLYYYEDYETGDISGYLRATGKQDAIAELKRLVQYKI